MVTLASAWMGLPTEPKVAGAVLVKVATAAAFSDFSPRAINDQAGEAGHVRLYA
jgi:hypothetical protein